jgi:U3 small nucleolar RNA-associated protein 4
MGVKMGTQDYPGVLDAESVPAHQVHRIRFVDWTPSSITALAFPPCAPPSLTQSYKGAAAGSDIHFEVLAVGRENGNIELCEWAGVENEVQAPQAWTTRKVF